MAQASPGSSEGLGCGLPGLRWRLCVPGQRLLTCSTGAACCCRYSNSFVFAATRNPLLLHSDPCLSPVWCMVGGPEPRSATDPLPQPVSGVEMLSMATFPGSALNRNAWNLPLHLPSRERGNEVPRDPSQLGPHSQATGPSLPPPPSHQESGAFLTVAEQSLRSQVRGGTGGLPSASQVPPHSSELRSGNGGGWGRGVRWRGA